MVRPSPGVELAGSDSKMIEEIERGLEIILAPGSVVEIRLPHSRQGTMSGYFDNFDLFASVNLIWPLSIFSFGPTLLVNLS